MKITTLIENRVSRKELIAEHGLSFYIEANGYQILFDTGAGENFAKNASVLGIDISTLDYLVVSHGHSDHTGGLGSFMQLNKRATIYLKKEVFSPKFKNDFYIGVNPEINSKGDRFRFVDEVLELVPDVFIVPRTEIHFQNDQHKSNFYTLQNGVKIPDDFNDELFLVLKSAKGNSIISSCSHNGITNIIHSATQMFNEPVVNVIGGFHLKDVALGMADHLAKYFNRRGIRHIYSGHCTGVEMFAQLKTKCVAKVHYNETGDVIEL